MPVSADPSQRGKFVDPVAVAVLATLISGAWAGRPSLWFDEAATISAATDRSLPQLWRLLSHVDAVHGLYYLLMHGWFTLFPATEFWSRAPSCLAVGVAAAGVVVFTKLFTGQSTGSAGRMTAGCAGIVFAILPRITWAGIEARSYALMAAAGVWLTVLFVVSVRRNRPWLWVLYALALMLSILLNIDIVLVALAFAAMLPALTHRKSVILRWAGTSLAALAVTAPFILFAHRQIGQIGWIAEQKQNLFLEVALAQYFSGAGPVSEHRAPVDQSIPFAILAGVVIVAALATRLAGVSGNNRESRQLVFVCVAWTGIPTGIDLAYSVLVQPVYQPRYLTPTAPAIAVILTVCIVTIGRKPWRIAGILALFAIAAFPNYFSTQRGPYAKQGWDYSQVADVINAQATPGDCFLLDGDVWQRSLLVRARPTAFQSLVDVERGTRAPDLGTLGDSRIPVWLRTGRINQCTTIWTITDRDMGLPDHQRQQSLPPGQFERRPAYQVPAGLGFRIVERWQFTFMQVVKAMRG
ncbi:MAG: hypothetical protein K2Q25_06570 [Mycobacteriaceae bacterium]|nr:hypothetical protein [Mycobacteriaceae bacterium]